MSSAELPCTVRDGPAGASYTYLFPGEIAGTVEVRPDVNVDISADRTVLGVEVIGDAPWAEGLIALALAGRLRVAPGKAARPAGAAEKQVPS